MRTYYRKAWDIRAYTYHANVYCLECGESLPEVDPEGNDRHPVFESDEVPSYWACGTCGEYID
jgi:hypothetical protein